MQPREPTPQASQGDLSVMNRLQNHELQKYVLFIEYLASDILLE